MSEPKDMKQLLHTATYHPAEIERLLDPKHPAPVGLSNLSVAGGEIEYYTASSLLRDGLWASTNARNGPNRCSNWPTRLTRSAKRAPNAPAHGRPLTPGLS